jgi:hypothetical protein
VETCFQNAKGAVGLDEHQVRRWDSWHRYTTLVMLAAAILTAIAANESRNTPEPALIPLTVTEARRLFATLITHTTRPASHHHAWSRWRRLHQARARTSHYRTRGDSEHRPTPT